MKTNKILTAAICLLMLSRTNAQGYGTMTYPHPNSVLSSAKTTNMNINGFLMAGSMANASGMGADFEIDQVDANAVFAAPGVWSNDYRIDWDPTGANISTNFTYPHGCIGVDIIETNPGTNGERYALAGACADGIFFATLDVNGVPLRQEFFPFNANIGIYGMPTNRPQIRESATNPGWYYICGDEAGSSYVIKIASVSTPGEWAQIYTGFPNEARAVIENPSGSDVIVVGRLDQVSFGLATEAFFMSLDPNTGNVNYINCYSDGGNGDEWFTSIENAASPTGGSGYIIGGRIHSSILNNIGYKPWMIKLDFNGNVIWSTMIRHSINSNPLEITDVLERLNTSSGANTYEYFGVANTPVSPTSPTTNWMTVWKLDDTGAPTPGINEFPYSLGGLSSQWRYHLTQVELIGNGSVTPGDGLQVFGTDENASDHVLVSAYFDGNEGCYTPSTWGRIQGPGMTVNPTLQTMTFPMFPFTLTQNQTTIIPANPCNWVAMISGASNARGGATGIQNNRENANTVSVHPNPTNQSLTVAFKNVTNSPVQITLVNSLGQLQKEIEISNNMSSELVLDLEALQLSDGLYFVNVTMNKETFTTKVMYQK
ncbi:MAG: T9SS type A sorting domain-containing protein [Bacteroidota bacterium]